MHRQSITPDREIAAAMGSLRRPLVQMPGSLTYRARNDLLRAMGYASYRAYCRSLLWGLIRQWAFAACGRECWICLAEDVATQVHHQIYTAENLAGLSLWGLRPVCWPCHSAIELHQDGTKRNQWEVDGEARDHRLSVVIRRDEVQA